jgi:hypothetical protein
MNSAMTNMHVPGSMNPMQTAAPQFYYAMIEGNQAGPFSEQELSRLIAEKKVVKETYIWKPGLPKWEIAEKLPEILKLVALAPPPFQSKSINYENKFCTNHYSHSGKFTYRLWLV